MPQTTDWLGAQGTSFSQAFITTPTCCPSRSTILTGRLAHNHTVRTNALSFGLDPRSTLSAYLQAARYETGIYGKFFNSLPIYLGPPYYNDWAITDTSGAYYGALWNINGNVRQVQTYGTQFVSDHAANFIASTEANDARPWFAYVAPPAPHRPFTPEPAYENASVPEWDPPPSVFEGDPSVDPGGLTDKPAYVQEAQGTPQEGGQIRQEQLRTLLSVDDMMGRLHRELDDLGESENTLVFFISDNGFLWGQHRWIGKFVPYTESIQVPFYVSWPNTVQAGATSSRLVANTDIAPTVLQAAGIQPRELFPMDGHSLLDDSYNRNRIFTESFNNPDPVARTVPRWASIRNPQLQYVEYYNRAGSAVVNREYYDLAQDPYQLDNLLGDGDVANDPPPEEIDQLHEQLAQDEQCVGASCP